MSDAYDLPPAIAAMIEAENAARQKWAQESRELDELIDNAEDEGD